MIIVFDHTIGIDAQSCHTLRLFFQMSKNVHTGGIPPAEEGFVVLYCLIDEFQAGIEELFIYRLHALGSERSSVFDLLSPVRVGPAVQYPTGSELLLELWIFRIVRTLGLLFRVEVVKVPEEFIEPVSRWKELVSVTEMVLTKLSTYIAERLQHIGDRWVFRPQTEIGSWQSHFSKTGANRGLASNECGPAGRTTLLSIPISKEAAFSCYPIDIRRPVSHHSEVVR